MEFLKSLLGSLSSDVFNLLIYAVILFVFIMGFLKCVLPVLRTRSVLRRAIRHIRAGNESGISWQEDGFLGRGILAAHWTEYLNNLFFADGVYHNASNVEDYINEDTVIYGPGRSAFSEAVPGLLVSIGFLGTLIGLAQGLSGFSMSDSQAVMDSIVTLIPGMRYAFMTSIFGVIGSVCFTMLTRTVYGSTENVLRNFYGAMSRYAGVRSVDPMTQVAIYQQEQTAIMKKIADDIDGERIAEAIRGAVEPLNQSMRGFVSVTTKDQMRFLDAVVGRFIDRMDESLNGQFKRLSHTMSEAADYQESTMKAVRASLADTADMLDSIQEVTRIADSMVRNNAAYVDALRENQKKTSEAFDAVASSVEQMELVSRQQNNYLKTVSAMQAEITGAVEQITESVSGFTQRFAEENAAASAGMMKAAAELRATGAELEGIHKDCTDAIMQELRSTMDAYQDYVNQFTQRVDYLSSSITESVGKLPRAVDDSANQFLDQIDRLTDALAEAQRALNQTVAQFYGERR